MQIVSPVLKVAISPLTGISYSFSLLLKRGKTELYQILKGDPFAQL